MLPNIQLTPEEALKVTSFFQWADAFSAGTASALEAAKRQLLDGVLASRQAQPQEQPPAPPANPTAPKSKK